MVILLVFFADKTLYFSNKIPFPFPLAERLFYAVLAACLLSFFRFYIYCSPLLVLCLIVAAMFLKEIYQWRFFKTAHYLVIFLTLSYSIFSVAQYLNLRQFVLDYQNTSTFYEKYYADFTPPPPI